MTTGACVGPYSRFWQNRHLIQQRSSKKWPLALLSAAAAAAAAAAGSRLKLRLSFALMICESTSRTPPPPSGGASPPPPTGPAGCYVLSRGQCCNHALHC
jgi:hypothetical protein